MPKYSVKKPFTILVAVILVLVLGVVSLLRIQTDLLPSMNLPYLLVMTTYPGASPEQVEADVTQPLENSLSTLNGVKNVTSQSNENYSLIFLEYQEDTDMDSAMVKASTAVNQLGDTLPDMASTPTLIEISPDMMATQYVAVDCEGMDIYELSDYINDTILPQLERVDGVASVSTTGLVKQTVQITLDQDIAVSGTVISDWASPNMAGSPMPKAAEKPDLGINDCTAYMQNADASLGLALVTTDAQQNNLQRYDKLKLWCKGLTLTKRSNPERYTLSGVTQDHIVTKEAGTAEELPAKRRFIDQLTDADIYTQVTLKRCQMAVRTGRFIPVHINYTNSFNNYYPAAVLDRHGDMIYLMTNHGCDWRFKEMPDGEGTLALRADERRDKLR